MGTLSKRPLKDFGLDIRNRIDHVRHDVGEKIETIAGPEGSKKRARAWFIVGGAVLVPVLVMLGIYLGRKRT